MAPEPMILIIAQYSLSKGQMCGRHAQAHFYIMFWGLIVCLPTQLVSEGPESQGTKILTLNSPKLRCFLIPTRVFKDCPKQTCGGEGKLNSELET